MIEEYIIHKSYLEQQPFFFFVVASDEGCFKTVGVNTHKHTINEALSCKTLGALHS